MCTKYGYTWQVHVLLHTYTSWFLLAWGRYPYAKTTVLYPSDMLFSCSYVWCWSYASQNSYLINQGHASHFPYKVRIFPPDYNTCSTWRNTLLKDKLPGRIIKHRQHEVSIRCYRWWTLYVNLQRSVLGHVKYTIYVNVDCSSKNIDFLDNNRKLKS
jgi:hypothetical protein